MHVPFAECRIVVLQVSPRQLAANWPRSAPSSKPLSCQSRTKNMRQTDKYFRMHFILLILFSYVVKTSSSVIKHRFVPSMREEVLLLLHSRRFFFHLRIFSEQFSLFNLPRAVTTIRLIQIAETCHLTEPPSIASSPSRH